MTGRRRAGLPRTAGFSLVELMVALTLGLLVAAAIGYVFSSSKVAFNTSEGMSRLQESSRTALLVTNGVIRNTGYLPTPLTQTNPTTVFVSPALPISGGLGSAVHTAFANVTTPTLPTRITGTNDYLQIAFVGNSDNTMSDCVGRVISVNEISIDVFYVTQNAGDPDPSLYCTTWSVGVTAPGGALIQPVSTMALINGVTNMAVTYGLDIDKDQQVDTYVADPLPTGMTWTQVKSVSLQLTIESQDAVTTAPNVAATAASPHGQQSGHFVRVVTQNINLRNRLIP